MYNGVEILTPCDVEVIEDRVINIPIHFDESFRSSVEKRVSQMVNLLCDKEINEALNDRNFINGIDIEQMVRQTVETTINQVVRQLVKEEREVLFERIANRFDTDKFTVNLCRAILEKNKEVRRLERQLREATNA